MREPVSLTQARKGGMANVTLVAGLSFGDEGKGSIVDYLCRRGDGSHTVVRYNGGAQAAHNVCCPDGTHHTFAQFGSGSFAGARTHLSSFMLVNPVNFLAEGRALQEHVPDCYDRVTVERGALVTNPFQVAANRLHEMAMGGRRHGSCGLGINETVKDSEAHPEETIRVGDLTDKTRLREKLEFSRQLKLSVARDLARDDEAYSEWNIINDPEAIDEIIEMFEAFANLVKIVDDGHLRQLLHTDENIVFEGAQGVLLDEEYGFFPHCTRSKTTFANAFKLLENADFDPTEATRLGVMRAYTTRHGAGPFPSEDQHQTCGQDHNTWGRWQQTFRTGHLDLVLVKYALDVIGGVDEIALCHLDHVTNPQKVCVAYENEGLPLPVPRLHYVPGVVGPDREDMTQSMFHVKPVYEERMMTPGVEDFGVDVTIESHGPTALDKTPTYG